MSTPFLAELRWVSFNFAPKGWALANGQTLPINQNQALFALMGTTYGGNGQTTFALPDLRGRVAIHQGSGHTLGEKAGEEAHTVIQSEMPAHIHIASATTNAANQSAASPHLLAQAANLYTPFANPVAINSHTLAAVGGSQPHENRQPYTVLACIIALQGIFPSQN